MAAIANADILNNYPVLQLAAGALVVIVGVYMTLKAAGDNKKTGHIAPPGHDPLGLTVLANGMVGMLAGMVELLRSILGTMGDIRVEIAETNSKLDQLRESHHSEMDVLRRAVENGPQNKRQIRDNSSDK